MPSNRPPLADPPRAKGSIAPRLRLKSSDSSACRGLCNRGAWPGVRPNGEGMSSSTHAIGSRLPNLKSSRSRQQGSRPTASTRWTDMRRNPKGPHPCVASFSSSSLYSRRWPALPQPPLLRHMQLSTTTRRSCQTKTDARLSASAVANARSRHLAAAPRYSRR